VSMNSRTRAERGPLIPYEQAREPEPRRTVVDTARSVAQRAARRGWWLRVAAAAVAGGLLVFAFPPQGLWVLAPVSVAGLSLLVRGRGTRHGMFLGWVYGLAFFVPLLHWTGIYVGPAPWLILAVAESVFIALLGGTLALTSRLRLWPLWTATLWVAEEAVRDRAPFGGFPWGRLAFGTANSPLVWFAAWGGAPLVTFAVALAGAFLASTAYRGWAARAAYLAGAARGALVLRVVPALVGLAAVAGAAALAHPLAPRPGEAGTVNVAIVQGNVPRLGLDFNAQRAAVLRNHVNETLRLARRVADGAVARPQLVIWPENASDIDPLDDPAASNLISQAATAVGVPILVGAVLDGPGDDHITNAGIVWDPATGPGERYVKRHPVPFGEYIPLRSVARRVSSATDRVGRDMVAGTRPGRLNVGPVRLGDVICFEVAYDGIVNDATDGTGLLVVQTNNATFGRSGETQQQLAMGRLRAVEHGRTVLVAATSGVSAIIDPDGDVRAESAIFTPDVLAGTVSVRTGSTLASHLGALPEWAAVCLAALGLVLVGTRGVRSRRSGAADSEETA
jgi:apolipoprotein N-acyltransferase